MVYVGQLILYIKNPSKRAFDTRKLMNQVEILSINFKNQTDNLLGQSK